MTASYRTRETNRKRLKFYTRKNLLTVDKLLTWQRKSWTVQTLNSQGFFLKELSEYDHHVL